MDAMGFWDDVIAEHNRLRWWDTLRRRTYLALAIIATAALVWIAIK
jgi:hypothetical protein